MRSVVTGLMMLAGAVVRDKGHGFDDFGWRREVQQAREAQEADATTSGSRAGDGEAVVVAGPPIGTFGPSSGALMSVAGDRSGRRGAGRLGRRLRARGRRPAGVRSHLAARDGRRHAVSLGTDWRCRAGERRHDLHGGRRLPRQEHRGDLARQAQRNTRRHLWPPPGRRRLRRPQRGQDPGADPRRLGRVRGGAPNASATPRVASRRPPTALSSCSSKQVGLSETGPEITPEAAAPPGEQV